MLVSYWTIRGFFVADWAKGITLPALPQHLAHVHYSSISRLLFRETSKVARRTRELERLEVFLNNVLPSIVLLLLSQRSLVRRRRRNRTSRRSRRVVVATSSLVARNDSKIVIGRVAAPSRAYPVENDRGRDLEGTQTMERQRSLGGETNQRSERKAEVFPRQDVVVQSPIRL